MEKNNDIHNYKILTIYSVIAYVSAYLVIFLTYNITTALVASSYNIKTLLNINKLIYITEDRSLLWTFDSVFSVFSSGTIILIILLLVLMKIFNKRKDHLGLVKIFFFWLIVHCINRIIGLFILGTIFNLYLSNLVLTWLYFEYLPTISLVITAMFLLIFIGSKTTRPLLISAKSSKFVEKRKRLFFIWSQGIKVWFFSSIIIFLLHLPSFSLIENFLSITMFVLVLPSYFNHKNISIPISSRESEEPKYKIPWKYILFSLISIVVFKVIFTIGIKF